MFYKNTFNNKPIETALYTQSTANTRSSKVLIRLHIWCSHTRGVVYNLVTG